MPPKTTSAAARENKPASRTRSVRTAANKAKKGGMPSPDHWNLRLYVAGQTPKSVAAIANLRRFCEEHLANRYSIEVVDLLENPGQARTDQILAIPTLVRKLPAPMRKIIGDLSSQEKVLLGFDIQQAL